MPRPDRRDRASGTRARYRNQSSSWPNYREVWPLGHSGSTIAYPRTRTALMVQQISVVIPVYDGVTQLDFTGPHQFLSRTPDVQVRAASLDGRPITADRLTFSDLEDLGTIASCDVLLVPGGGGCLNAIENDRFLEEIARLGATPR